MAVRYYTFNVADNQHEYAASSGAEQPGGTVTDSDAGDTDFTNLEAITGDLNFGSGDFLGHHFVPDSYPVVWVSFLGADPGGSDNFAAYSSSPLFVPDGFGAAGGGTSLSSIISGTYTTCFGEGTLIATPEGERKVGSLQIRDLVTTAEGCSGPVKWVGRQTVLKLFSGDRACPMRVAAGALEAGMPHSDLVLTADHALILDGLAINAGALFNGTTITRDPLDSLPDRVTYYHVETENHELILANGVAAETYVDYIQRQVFEN